MTENKEYQLDETIENCIAAINGMNDAGVKIQRSFYVPKWLWDAAEKLPIARPEIITQALLNAVSAYKSEIPQLLYEADQLKKEIGEKEARIAAIYKRVEELRKQESEGEKLEAMNIIAAKQAIQETLSLQEMFRRDMNQTHFKRLESLSNIPSKEIKAFLNEKNFSATEGELTLFYMR